MEQYGLNSDELRRRAEELSTELATQTDSAHTDDERQHHMSSCIRLSLAIEAEEKGRRSLFTGLIAPPKGKLFGTHGSKKATSSSSSSSATNAQQSATAPRQLKGTNRSVQHNNNTSSSAPTPQALQQGFTAVGGKSNSEHKKRSLASSPAFTCMTYIEKPESVFAGRSNGELVHWKIPSRSAGQFYNNSTVLGSHLGCVTALAFHHYGSLLISGSSDAKIKVWDPHGGESPTGSGRCIQTLPAHDATVTSIVSHCNLIISGSVDKTVKVWKFAEARQNLCLPWLVVKQVFVFDSWVATMWASPTKIAEQSQAEVYACDSNGLVTLLRSHIAHSEDANDVIVTELSITKQFNSCSSSGGGGGGTTTAASTSSVGGQPQPQLQQQKQGLVAIHPIPRTNHVVTLGYDNCARIRDVIAFSTLVTVDHPENGRFIDCSWDPTNEELYLLDAEGQLFVWSTKRNSFLYSVRIGPDACAVYFVAHRGAAWVAHHERIDNVAIERSTTLVEHAGHTQRVISVCFRNTADYPLRSEDEFWMVTASVDNTIRLWNPNVVCLRFMKEKQSEISAFALLRRSPWCVTGHDNGSIKFWSIERDAAFRFTAHENTVSVVGEGLHQIIKGEVHSWPHIFTASYDGCLAVWEMPTEGSTAKCEGRVRISHSELICAVYDPLNYCYIVGGNTGDISVWSVEDLKPLRQFTHQGRCAHLEAVTYLGLDANFCVSGGEDETLLVWNTLSGKLVKELVFQGKETVGEIQCFCIMDDDVLISTRSGHLILYNQTSGEATHHYEIDREIASFAYYPKTDEIVAGLEDGVVLRVHASLLSPVVKANAVASSSTQSSAPPSRTDFINSNNTTTAQPSSNRRRVSFFHEDGEEEDGGDGGGSFLGSRQQRGTTTKDEESEWDVDTLRQHQ